MISCDSLYKVSKGNQHAMAGSSSNVHLETVEHVEDEPYAEITAAVKRQIAQSNKDLMKRVEERQESTISEAIKRALAACSESTSKKQKPDPTFKAQGNKVRYEANEEIKDKIAQAVKAIDSKDLEVAKAALEQGTKLVDKQQKLIRLADREEHGWEVVRHYLSDELASDSDDEKAIAKARRAALASISKRKAKKGEQFRNASHTKNARRNVYRSPTRETRKQRGQTDTSNGDRCYRCGNNGHYAFSCPLKYRR